MPTKLKAVLQYLLILSIAAFLVWFSLGSISRLHENPLDYIIATWNSANKTDLWLMTLLAMMSHVMRAERWGMLMRSAGWRSPLKDNFVSLMIGYLVNLAIPRGGEVSRCYNLYKLNKTPVDVSLGTVVAERAVDVLSLLLVILLAMFLETRKIFLFFDQIPVGGSLADKLLIVALIFTVLGMVFVVAIYLVRRNQKIWDRLRNAWDGFKKGLFSAFHVKPLGVFVFYSVGIWLLYFFMTYAVIVAFPETAVIGVRGVLVLFVIGSIAMALPLPGGTGSYHTLVPIGLTLLYGVARDSAVAFTFVFHAWQTLIMIVGGALSLLATAILLQLRQTKRYEAEEQNLEA